MKAVFARLLPRSLFGRIVLLLTVGLIGAQLIGATIHLSERFRLVSTTIAGEFAQQIKAVYRTIDQQPAATQVTLAQSLSTPRIKLAIVPQAAFSKELVHRRSTTSLALGFEDRLEQVLGPGVRWKMVKVPEIGDVRLAVVLELTNGRWLQVQAQPPPEVFGQPWHVLMGMSFMLLVIVSLVVVVARSTVRPLTRLASAANGVAQDLKRPPLPEDGPSEVREAARAFNTMQKRIREGIEERERFLAAVSHDLKTPITRLRLRAELLADSRVRDGIEHDINEMQQLIDDALAFLRGHSVDEPTQTIELVALIESVADDFGHIQKVDVSAPASLRFKGKPIALQRALRNLVDNAIKYGQHAQITLQQEASQVIIIVDDVGPGLSQEHLGAVFEPFFRVESSRSRETGGTGLGLAIVRLVAQSHGGSVRLNNRPEGGLRVELLLPII